MPNGFSSVNERALPRDNGSHENTKSNKLTDHVQMHDVTHVRRRGDLTLVETAVTKLRILDLKRPVVRVSVVDRPESLVVRVRVMTVCEQVDVPVPHPGNL